MAFIKFDSAKYTKDQLDAIVSAFADLCNGLDPHDFPNQTGEDDPAAIDNYREAKATVYPSHVFAPADRG